MGINGIVTCILLLVTYSTAEHVNEESGNIKMMTRLLNECSQQEDMSICFKLKAVNFLDRLARSTNPIAITDYLVFAKDAAVKENETDFQSVKDAYSEASLPRSLDEKSDRLDELMWNKFNNLISTRTLQVASSSTEARGKDPFKGGKKGGGMMMMAAMMAGMMMKMFMGKIALIAGKALIVAKIALVLAAVIGLKKLSGGGGGGGESHPQVVYATAEHSGGGGGGWQRSFDAHNLAYGSPKSS